MRRMWIVLGTVLLAACAVDQGVGTPTPSAPEPKASATSAITIAPTTAPPASAEPTSSGQETAPSLPSPTARILTVREFLDKDAAVVGGADVSIRAWADMPVATGWEAPYIEPAWLAYPPDGISMLWGVLPPGDGRMCSEDVDPACAALFIHVRPESGLSLGDTPGWVVVTGHVGDVDAESCHYVVGDDWPGDPPNDEGAREECRANFVLTGVSPAPD